MENVGNLPKRKTKIVATLGTASFDKIRELILAGVNVFRIKLPPVSDSQVQLIHKIRRMSSELQIPIGILGDLPGPKLHCGAMKDGRSLNLVKGSRVLLRAGDEPGEEGSITTPIRPLVRQLQVGHSVLLDSGTKKLRVVAKIGGPSAEEVECVVEVGGLLLGRMDINVPDLQIGVSALTDVDRKLLSFILEQNLDFVSISFVERSQDLIDAREHIAEFNRRNNDSAGDRNPMLIAKIEKRQAIDSLDEILEVADGLMVARGNLGLECSLERVPIHQKLIIEKANRAGKVVITATQMLESMINSPMPTRAEVTDVANAIFDGTDALMLSGETAVGKYPVETVAMMDLVSITAEENHELIHVVPTDMGFPPQPYATAISEAAVTCAKVASAKAVIVLTGNGEMARLIAKKKAVMPVIAVTHTLNIVHQLVLLWGIHPLFVELPTTRWISTDHLLSYSEHAIFARGWVQPNAPVVFAMEHRDALAGVAASLRLMSFGSVSKAFQTRND